MYTAIKTTISRGGSSMLMAENPIPKLCAVNNNEDSN
jgi:hypothetical protein